MLHVLHTADWHLGQSLHGFDRDHEHGQFLDWLVQTIQERRPDVLLIAGDIFDTVNPSAAAQRRFFSFLARARGLHPTLQVVIIAGNHDAAARLEAPAGLMESLGISTIGLVTRGTDGEIDLRRFLIPLRDGSGQVAALVLAIPFLRPSDVPLVPGAADPYLDGIRELYHRTLALAVEVRDREYPGAALLAMGHCHLCDAQESESERRIVIGMAEAIGSDTFPPALSYVALGHLHLPQSFDGGRVRYSGSPIPLSFSERNYQHAILEVKVAGDASVTVESLPVPRTVALLRLPAGSLLALPELLLALEAHPFDATLPAERHPLLEVRVLDDGPDPTRRRRIEEVMARLPARLATIKAERAARVEGAEAPAAVESISLADLQSMDPVELMNSAHQERYGTPVDDALRKALQELLLAEETAVEGGQR